MDTSALKSQSPGVMLTLAAFVIIVAGMRAAQSLVVPFLLAGFVAIICGQPLYWLKSKKVPGWLALLIIIIAVLILGLTLGAIIGESIVAFSDSLPFYQDRIQTLMVSLQTWLDELGIEVPADTLSSYLNVEAIMSVAAGMLSGIGGMLSSSFMLLLTVIFILIEVMSSQAKIKAAFNNPLEKLGHIQNFTNKVNRYMAIKTMTSFATGVLVAIWLAILGVDFPLLWGLLAFLLNYVPSIGSIIAAIPAVILSLIQLGPGTSALAAAGYLVINSIIGSGVEPKFMGRGLGLSILVVFVSLVFWGWVLGPVGMFLSVPLTMMVKLALETNENTRWMAILLSSDPEAELKPEAAD
jgi:predicted PurR-regulated permease PerM